MSLSYPFPLSLCHSVIVSLSYFITQLFHHSVTLLLCRFASDCVISNKKGCVDGFLFEDTTPKRPLSCYLGGAQIGGDNNWVNSIKIGNEVKRVTIAARHCCRCVSLSLLPSCNVHRQLCHFCWPSVSVSCYHSPCLSLLPATECT